MAGCSKPSELKEWRGERSQAGRIVPRGWAKIGNSPQARTAANSTQLRRGR